MRGAKEEASFFFQSEKILLEDTKMTSVGRSAHDNNHFGNPGFQ
jgi:hypothetical protein